MQQDNYAMFDGDKDDALDYVETCLKSFVNYANAVLNQVQQEPIIQARYDGEELRDKRKQLDDIRTTYHNTAIGGVDKLNRLCKHYKLEPWANIDTSDRYNVTEFVGNYIGETYGMGANMSMDEITLRITKPYDAQKIHENIEDMVSQNENMLIQEGPEL